MATETFKTVEHTLSCSITQTTRSTHIATSADLTPTSQLETKLVAQLPDHHEWQIGVIVGSSGSGKSSIARKEFPNELFKSARWPKNKSILDGFDSNLSTDEITKVLTSVGFATVPAWQRPYHVLSEGEKFRANLARSILSKKELVVYDEYTSVVDRDVAKIGSAALAKTIRANRAHCKRFVAVTCHYDIIDWLEPDWVLDMKTGELTYTRGRLRRPEIKLEIYKTKHSAWSTFSKHHYLTGSLHKSASCFIAFIRNSENELIPACFVGCIHAVGHADIKRVSRIVTLPEFQGVGIAGRVLSVVGDFYKSQGYRFRLKTSHRQFIKALHKNQAWRTVSFTALSKARHRGSILKATARGSSEIPTSYGRQTGNFEYRGSTRAKEQTDELHRRANKISKGTSNRAPRNKNSLRISKNSKSSKKNW